MPDATTAPGNPASGIARLQAVENIALRRRRNVALRKFLRHRLAVIGAVVFVILVLSAAFAVQLTPYDPYKVDMRARLIPPSAAHLFGTDELGRDQLVRVMLGGQVSLAIAVLSIVVALIVGVSVGSVAGYYGGRADNLLMRLTDLMFIFPPIVLAMIAVSVMGQTIFSVAVTIGIVSWMGLARLVRASFLSMKEQEFVTAARSLGADNRRIIIQHILPNITGTIIVVVTLGMARAILFESALSYLGLGIQVPVPSWGSMLYMAQNQLRNAVWLPLAPGAMIFLAVLSINFIGDGLRDALDPRSK